MKDKRILIVAGTSILVIGVLYLALKNKKSEKDNNIVDDIEFQELLKKIDNAKK